MARGYIPMVGGQAPLINTSAQLLHITQHDLCCNVLRQFAPWTWSSRSWLGGRPGWKPPVPVLNTILYSQLCTFLERLNPKPPLPDSHNFECWNLILLWVVLHLVFWPGLTAKPKSTCSPVRTPGWGAKQVREGQWKEFDISHGFKDTFTAAQHC